MQRVTVDPPLEEQRDLAALASHMGLRAFHDWMRAMLGGDTLPVGGGAWDEDAGSRGNRPQGLGYDRLTLEDILTSSEDLRVGKQGVSSVSPRGNPDCSKKNHIRY